MLTEQWLLWIGAGGFLLFGISSLFRMKKWPTYVAFAGCLCIIAVLLLRWYTSGRAPWATLYETAALTVADHRSGRVLCVPEKRIPRHVPDT